MRPMLAAAPTREPGIGAKRAASVGKIPAATSVVNAAPVLSCLNLP